MSERRDEIQKHKKERKNRNYQSAEQYFTNGHIPKQSRSSMVDPIGHRKVK